MYKEMLDFENRFLAMLDQLEEANGELDPELEKKWDALITESAGVADKFVDVIKYLLDIVATNKEKANIYKAKAKSAENHIAFLRKKAEDMIRNGVTFESETGGINIVQRKVPKINLDWLDWKEVPEEFIQTTKKLRMKDYLKAIASGKAKAPAAYNVDTIDTLTIR